jgi:hypothetical protein
LFSIFVDRRAKISGNEVERQALNDNGRPARFHLQPVLYWEVIDLGSLLLLGS